MTNQERQTLEHEAGHAASALTQGLRVSAVSRVSPDPRRYLGATDLLIEDLDRTKARKWAMMLLAGPGMAEEPLPTWPLSENKTNDEKLLKIFVEYLDLDEEGYEELIDEMWATTDTRKFSRLFIALTTWLEQRPRMDQADVARAMTLAWM